MSPLRIALATALAAALWSCGASPRAPETTSAPASAWTPFDLGGHHRPVSTSSPEAQKAFDQGLIWAFAFNHDEAIRAFEEAARRDPQLAMAHWGIALVNGPHINNPGLDEAHAKAAWTALEKARELKGAASAVERALIDALGARYAWPNPADRAPLDAAYAQAMAEVHRRFPKDADVATLYAESLMDTRPWDQWTKDGQPQPGTSEVLAALETALLLDPDHPGALHLWIHALEASPHPERATQHADRLRALVPDSSHLVHMPSHIDVRLGRWAEAAAANERAIQTDARYTKRQPRIGFYAVYKAHNAHFLAYTAMMEGRSAAALERTDEIVRGLPPEKVRENPLFLDAFLTVGLEARKRFGRWEEILAAPAPLPEFPVATAFWRFARAVAFAATNRLDEAERERAAFREALTNIPKEAYWGSNPAVDVLGPAVPYLDGEIAYRSGRLDDAATLLAQAVRLEDALKYDEPPAWTTPARHALGAVLLEAGRHQEAADVYREDLRRYPENGWSLWGLSRALEAQGQSPEHAAVSDRFRKAWARADIEIGASCLCVKSAVKG